MDADGTREGYDLPMTRAVADAVSIPVVASGGAVRRNIFARPWSKEAPTRARRRNLPRVQYTIAEVKRHLASQGVIVREVENGRESKSIRETHSDSSDQ